MAVLKSTPTATAPALPTCTIIANNQKYHTYISEHWPYCIIKQTYNPEGANFTLSANSTYTNPSPIPKSKDDPRDSAAISAYIPLGIIAAIGLGFFISCLISTIAHAIKKCKRGRRRARPASNSSPRKRIGFREAKAWFGRQHASLLGRDQDRSLESAVRTSPLQRGLHRMRTFGKSSPRVPPYQSPNPDLDPNGAAGEPSLNLELAALPPAYQSAEHLPPPALPLAAHLPGGQRERVSDDPIAQDQSQGQRPRERLRNEPPPPDYRDRHQDILYTSETESESGSDWDVNADNNDEDVNELAVVNARGRIWNDYWRSINEG